jgi:multiple sugar transport system permease protein
LQLFKGAHGTEWGPLMAASLIMVVPVIVLFFSAQKYFIQGVTLTGMKG